MMYVVKEHSEEPTSTKGAAPIVVGVISPFLLAFLHGTIQSESPLSKLRGQEHILRIIWDIACEEWIDLHVFRSSSLVEGIPNILPWADEYPSKTRHPLAGCPIAVIANYVEFPPVSEVPVSFFDRQDGTDLYVNMMPIDLLDKDSMPPVCRGYWPLIEQCLRVVSVYKDNGDVERIAYLTIDERLVPTGSSQRRPGLHVESPGVMPLVQTITDPSEAQYTIQSSSGTFVPGAEHHWGGGLMIRDEMVEGGIFMASNIADTTAVWNCTINDEDGDFIGAHGDIEYFRELLGPCARTLEANELIWMTDRTPHESLPIPASAGSQRRQYFRLVVGEVSAWFADHSTPNPLGTVPPPEVRIVHGDKFALYPAPTRSWHCGSPEQISKMKRLLELREKLYLHGLGHMTQRVFEYGLCSIDDVVRVWQAQREKQKAQSGRSREFDWERDYSVDGKCDLFTNRGCYYYERMNWEVLLKDIETERRLPALQPTPPSKKAAHSKASACSPPPIPVRTTAKTRHASAHTAAKTAAGAGAEKTTGTKIVAAPRWK